MCKNKICLGKTWLRGGKSSWGFLYACESRKRDVHYPSGTELVSSVNHGKIRLSPGMGGRSVISDHTLCHRIVA